MRPDILLVDDSEMSVFITEHSIKTHDDSLIITKAFNGKEACDAITSQGEIFPKLIILDLNMPFMSGFEFLEWYRSNGHTGSCNIVILTSSHLEDDKIRANSYEDVIAYVEKPLTIPTFLRVTSSISF